MDPELQCAALKAVSIIPVNKMISHLERGRIPIVPCLSSQTVAVRKQSCTTASFLLRERFTQKQVELFSPLWVPHITRFLWSESDAAAIQASSSLLRHICMSVHGLVESARDFGTAMKCMLSEFAAVPTSLFVACERVRLASAESVCGAMLFPLACVVQSMSDKKGLVEWFTSEVLLGRMVAPNGSSVIADAAHSVMLLATIDAQLRERAQAVLLNLVPVEVPDFTCAYHLDQAVTVVRRLPDAFDRINLLKGALGLALRKLNLSNLDSADNIMKSSEAVTQLLHSSGCWGLVDEMVKQEFALSLFMAARSVFLEEDNAPARCAAVCIACSECWRWVRVVRALYACLFCDAMDRLSAATSAYLSSMSIILDGGMTDSRLALVAAALFWPEDKLTEVVRTASVHLNRHQESGTANKSTPNIMVRPLHDSSVEHINMLPGALQENMFKASPGEPPTTLVIFVLSVCGRRAARSGAAAVLVSMRDQWHGDPVLRSFIRSSIQQLNRPPTNLKCPQFSFFSPASAAVEPFAQGSSDSLALSYVLALGMPEGFVAVSKKQTQLQARVRAWTRVSSDSSPLLIHCRHEVNLARGRLTLRVRVRNTTSLKLPNVKLSLNVPPALEPEDALSGSSQMFQVLSDMGPDRVVKYSWDFYLPRNSCMTFPLSFSFDFTFAPSAPSTTQVLYGRTMYCTPYEPSLDWTLCPLVITPAIWTGMWSKFGASFSETFCVDTLAANKLIMDNPTIHGTFVWNDEKTIRCLFSCVTLCKRIVLIRFVAEHAYDRWIIDCEVRSFDSQALWELQLNGGVPKLLKMNKVQRVDSFDAANVFLRT